MIDWLQDEISSSIYVAIIAAVALVFANARERRGRNAQDQLARKEEFDRQQVIRREEFDREQAVRREQYDRELSLRLLEPRLEAIHVADKSILAVLTAIQEIGELAVSDSDVRELHQRRFDLQEITEGVGGPAQFAAVRRVFGPGAITDATSQAFEAVAAYYRAEAVWWGSREAQAVAERAAEPNALISEEDQARYALHAAASRRVVELESSKREPARTRAWQMREAFLDAASEWLGAPTLSGGVPRVNPPPPSVNGE